MEPKFQSSFIPKGPVAASGNPAPKAQKGKTILGIIGMSIFGIAVLASVGVFGYNYYLGSSIKQTGAELDNARASMDVEAINELIELDNRLISTEEILAKHIAVSPFFEFLEGATLQSVRFVELSYQSTDKGVEVRLDGQARSYTAVALQAEEFKRSGHFKDGVFSDLTLDEEGNVVFSYRASIDPELISYRRIVEREALFAEPVFEEAEETATSSEATTTPATQI